jgi:hypothetical protein
MVSNSMCMSWPLHCTHARASHVLKCTLISVNLVPNWALAKRGRGHIRCMGDELKLTSCFVKRAPTRLRCKPLTRLCWLADVKGIRKHRPVTSSCYASFNTTKFGTPLLPTCTHLLLSR